MFNPLKTLINPTPPSVILTVLDSPQVFLNITRTTANTIYWSDFQQTFSDWLARGGGWWVSGSGHKGSGVSGQDDNGGIGGASQYYLNLPLNSYVEFYVGVKLRYSGTGYAGIALINNNLNRLYEISINPSGASGVLTIWSYNVERSNGWSLLTSSSNFPYTVQWLTLIIRYQYAGSYVRISAEIYSENGEHLASASATSTSTRRFPAQYVGLEIDGGSALFDDFVISTKNPTILTVTGLPSFASVQLHDLNGSLVGEALSDINGTGTLNVIADLITGQGEGGVLTVNVNTTHYSLETSFPLIGGEEYFVSSTKVFEGYADSTNTSATIHFFINYSGSRLEVIKLYPVLTEKFDVRLILESLEAAGGFSLIITLESSNTSATPIVIVNGTVLSPYTSTLSLYEEDLNIVVSELFFRNNYMAKLSVEYCLSNKSVCVSYPLILYGLGGEES